MPVRGIRGAVRVASNSRDEIFARTQELLRAMVSANRVEADDVAAACFTMTPDLNADFPAYAARDMGWTSVPLMCASEVAVPGAMDRVVRILLLVNTNLAARAVRHQYLGETACLRPDLAKTAERTDRPRRSSRSSSNTSRSDGGKR
jgi:chorismate mutase